MSKVGGDVLAKSPGPLLSQSIACLGLLWEKRLSTRESNGSPSSQSWLDFLRVSRVGCAGDGNKVLAWWGSLLQLFNCRTVRKTTAKLKRSEEGGKYLHLRK